MVAAEDAKKDESPHWAPEPMVSATVVTPARSRFHIPDPAQVDEAALATAPRGLDARERTYLASCEEAIENLRMAFWEAGKALSYINKARLYREHYATFEEYCQARWKMSRHYAYRLMREYPIGEAAAMLPIGNTMNEAQARSLLPLAKAHGVQVVMVVYQTVLEHAADGRTEVNAKVLGDVAKIVRGELETDTPVADTTELTHRAATTVRAILAEDTPSLRPQIEAEDAAWQRAVKRLDKVIAEAENALAGVGLISSAQAQYLDRQLRALADRITARSS